MRPCLAAASEAAAVALASARWADVTEIALLRDAASAAACPPSALLVSSTAVLSCASPSWYSRAAVSEPLSQRTTMTAATVEPIFAQVELIAEPMVFQGPACADASRRMPARCACALSICASDALP